jgi:hypothetical protein
MSGLGDLPCDPVDRWERCSAHDKAKAAMRAIRAGSESSGACPRSGTSIASIAGWRACMAATVAVDKTSELPPRMTMSGTRAMASNSFHSAGSGFSPCDRRYLSRAIFRVGRYSKFMA